VRAGGVEVLGALGESYLQYKSTQDKSASQTSAANVSTGKSRVLDLNKQVSRQSSRDISNRLRIGWHGIPSDFWTAIREPRLSAP